MSNFIKDCLSGDAFLDEIDDYIDQWHDGDSTLELYDFLGMTKSEYSAFLKSREYLPMILKARKEKGIFTVVSLSEIEKMAARSNDSGKAIKLAKWLKEEGIWGQ